MPEKITAEQKLIDAVKEYMAVKMKVPTEATDGFMLKDGYPRVEYENGIYDQTVRIDIELTRGRQ